MKMLSMIAAVLLSSPALAGTFWHPDTDEVVVAGPDKILICYEHATCVGPTICGSWSCDEVVGLGAREPVYYSLGEFGPVKVIGARWAYAYAGGSLVPMSKD